MTSQRFPKTARLRLRREFRELLREGTHRQGQLISVHILPSPRAKLGISVSKKFGHSPARSRFKRQIRELFRRSTLTAMALHVRPLPGARHATYQQIQDEFYTLCEKSGSHHQVMLN